MGDKNVEPGVYTLHIDGQSVGKVVASYDFEDYREDADSYMRENLSLRTTDSCELVGKIKLDTFSLCKVFGIWELAYKFCPNRRVKYLMTHGKNRRVQYKNFKRALRLITKRKG